MKTIFENNNIQNISSNICYSNYLIIEQDFFITYITEKKIINFFKKKKYNIIIKINLISQIDIQKVYFEFQQRDLFCLKKILLLTFSKEKLDNYIIQMIQKIYQYNNENIILILKFNKLNNYNDIIYLKNKFHKKNFFLIYCTHLSKVKIKHWILQEIKQMNLNITLQAINILLYYYESHILKLYKILKFLKILNINNQLITIKYIKNIIEGSAIFSSIQWIDAIFTNNKKKAFKILQYFKDNQYNLLYIIKIIKINLIYLIHKKEKNIYVNYLNRFRKKYITTCNNIQIEEISKKCNYIKLYKITTILYKMDMNIKNNNNQNLWTYLKLLISIF